MALSHISTTLRNTREPESKIFVLINHNAQVLFRRMQNRESAVRSRMRKRNYQEELEDKIYDLEQRFKDMSEQNAGLSA